MKRLRPLASTFANVGTASNKSSGKAKYFHAALNAALKLCGCLFASSVSQKDSWLGCANCLIPSGRSHILAKREASSMCLQPPLVLRARSSDQFERFTFELLLGAGFRLECDNNSNVRVSLCGYLAFAAFAFTAAQRFF